MSALNLLFDKWEEKEATQEDQGLDGSRDWYAQGVLGWYRGILEGGKPSRYLNDIEVEEDWKQKLVCKSV